MEVFRVLAEMRNVQPKHYTLVAEQLSCITSLGKVVLRKCKEEILLQTQENITFQYGESRTLCFSLESLF